jgi:hypothetical protein
MSHSLDLDLADRDWYLDELYVGWRAASTEADAAYSAWKAWPDRDRYAGYVAATDRADAAVDHLAAAHELDRIPGRRSAIVRLFART